ncbi:MAG: hypothetical protein L0G22_13740, partial [Propionibacteriaceae bacterium]|nr:hypothetical protein [Propionibacteriaceae bacterium]
MRLRLGTRGSELARTQSGLIADALTALGHDVELITIRSEGDVTAASLVDAGGLGVFAAALRRALLAGEVDLAVHSLKDLPTAAVPGLTLAAIPARENPADVLCSRGRHTLASLPAGARVGTGDADGPGAGDAEQRLHALERPALPFRGRLVLPPEAVEQ